MGPHWELSDSEAQGIAVPIANIIGRYLDTDAMEKYSDPIALLIALGVVCAPRVVISISGKKKKEVVKSGPVKVNPSEQTVGSSRTDQHRDVGGDVGNARDDAETDANKLSNLVDLNAYG